jgi:hypothetical protein
VTGYDHRELSAPIRPDEGVRDSEWIAAVLGDHADDIGIRLDVLPQLRIIERLEVMEESVVPVAGSSVEKDLAICSDVTRVT